MVVVWWNDTWAHGEDSINAIFRIILLSMEYLEWEIVISLLDAASTISLALNDRISCSM